jgi:hypothetical protein
MPFVNPMLGVTLLKKDSNLKMHQIAKSKKVLSGNEIQLKI